MEPKDRRTLEDFFSLRDRVAVVTGGGGALCGTMAVALGRLGAKVAVLDLKSDAARDRSDQIRAEGGTAEPVACNVLEEDELRRACDRVSGLWGPPDVLINGAGKENI